jgi:hypothetical protein
MPAMQAAAAPAPIPAFERTMPATPAMAAAAGNFPATVPTGGPQFAATVPAGNAQFAATMPASALPGYDASQKDGPASQAQFEKTSVMTKPGAPELPKAGGGKTGQEP